MPTVTLFVDIDYDGEQTEEFEDELLSQVVMALEDVDGLEICGNSIESISVEIEDEEDEE